ncbi:hypothetical protein [Metabacillus fastidiosus]|uniref:hypothetical protein n=1 Tax=Metabacillus fastidiosus TaxID=1458 RepID=UPI003D27B072
MDTISNYASGAGLQDVDLKNLYNWLRNPQENRKHLISLSRYYYSKEGIVTDCYDMFNTLSVLNYSTLWENMQMKKFTTHKKTVDTFFKDIKIKKLIRDTIFSVIQDGTCVWYNRKNKYIQFLTDDQIFIGSMINGKWEVCYDLSYFDKFNNVPEKQAMINSAPEEVTLKAYNEYRRDKSKRYLPLDIKRTQVFKLRGDRNSPYGIPYCVPALSSIIHRDLLEKTEKALADRVINQVIVQKIGTMPSPDGKTGMPVPAPTVNEYHNNLKRILQKKYNTKSTENSSVAPLTVPSFVEIEELKINMTTFPKEIWDRVDRNIYQKLGYSSSINMGGGNGQSFGSSSINIEKIYSILYYIIEDIEEAVNEYLDYLVPSGNFNPRIWISRETILDKKTKFDHAKSLYLEGRGSLRHFVEAAGYSWDHYLSQVKYENEILKLDEILPVHQTSYTQSGKDSGRPEGDNTNENTEQSKGNNGNDTPSPSD